MLCGQKVAETTIQALRWLGARDHTFIYWDDASRTYQPTPFGKAVLASGLPPEVCLVLKVGGCWLQWWLAVVAVGSGCFDGGSGAAVARQAPLCRRQAVLQNAHYTVFMWCKLCGCRMTWRGPASPL